MKRLTDEADFDSAVSGRSAIVNVDKPTQVVRFHPTPGDCFGLREGFVTKVVENLERTGSYWQVESEAAARARWGDGVAVCKRCTPD